MFRRRRKAPADPLAHVDPAALPRRYAAPVSDALAARDRWRALRAGTRDGAVRDRLDAAGSRIDDGVGAVWSTVQRLMEIERVVAAIDADRVTADLKRARRDPAAGPALVDALTARFASVQRLQNAVDDTQVRLRLLDVRLSAAVAASAELALLGGGAPTAADDLGAVVDELEGLRLALDELN